MNPGAMRLLARAGVRVFFRTTEVEHAERLPDHGPVLVVANHQNGLVDGLLLIALLPRYPRFLGKATLFRILPLGPLLRLAGVVPVHRAKEGSTEANDQTFRTCRAVLRDGGTVGIFPEGISHDEASLQPLKTGAARIALGAVTEGAAGMVIAPVGLSYDDKARFGSRALVTVGAPIEVPDATPDDRGAVHALTEAIDAALRAVSPDFDSAAQMAELAAIAEVVARPVGSERRAPLSEREEVARSLARARPDDRAAAVAAFETYRRDLALLGTTDAQVAAGISAARLRLAVLWAVVRTVLLAPVALAGYAVHVVPYEIMRRIGKVPRNEGVRSTVKLLGCAVLFLLTWLVLAGVAASRWGAPAFPLVLVACPLAGYTTVRALERVYRVGGLLQGFGILRRRREALASVHEHRAALIAAARGVPSAGSAAATSAG